MSGTAVHIYTDGAASGNPGPGGFGVILKYGPHVKELSAGFRLTTNNRMELMAVIEGLRALKKPGLEVHVHTDSKYVADAVEKKWVFGWEKKLYVGKKNADLWKIFLTLYRQHHVRFHWIKGHAGHPENERCDELAVLAAQAPTNRDAEYEREAAKARQ